jgi:hypothetical protein
MTDTTEPNDRDREVAKGIADDLLARLRGDDGQTVIQLVATYRAEIEAAAEQRGYERGRASAVDWLRKEENWWRCAANLTFWQRIRLLGVTLSLCKARGIGSKNAAKYIFGKGPKIVAATCGFAANAIERNEQEIRDGE